MSLLPSCALTVVVPLHSMEGQKALRFHQKYLNLCSDEQRSDHEMEWHELMTEFKFFVELSL